MSKPISRTVLALLGLIAASLPAPRLHAQGPVINASNWGTVTAPVFNTAQAGVYGPTVTSNLTSIPAAELFPGPAQFGADYYHGVIPNGRIVRPVGTNTQVGMNPLGAALTPDGQFLVVTNNSDRNATTTSAPTTTQQSALNKGGYSLTVVRTADMTVVSQANEVGSFFVGLQVTGGGPAGTAAPFTVYAAGGADNDVKVFTVSALGVISTQAAAEIPITPITPSTQGFVSNYTVAPGFNEPRPSQFNTAGAQITFPAGLALSPDRRFLYVACNGDNSLAVIDTASRTVVRRAAVGYFPYGVSVSADGTKVAVSDWGVTEYKFLSGLLPDGSDDPAVTGLLRYDTLGRLMNLARISPPRVTEPASTPGAPDRLFFVPRTSTVGANRKTSSIHLLSAPGGDGAALVPQTSVYQGKPLDALFQVGDTHPSATAVVRRGGVEVLYVTKTNSDSLGLIQLNNNRRITDFDLSPLNVTIADGHRVRGAQPNALVASPDGSRLYVAEAGLNAVAVLDTSNPVSPRLLGRIPAGWYPTALTISPDGNTLYVVNAKGVGEDITNPAPGAPNRTETSSQPLADSNFIFGSAQKVNLLTTPLENTSALANNFAVNVPANTEVVPVGGQPSARIKHVFFILQENKTFDSILGQESAHFGVYAQPAATSANPFSLLNPQYSQVAVNKRLLARTFATAANYYSDAEESDAGHQVASSGIVSDYSEKTRLNKSDRGQLVEKNFDPEDYPEGGYLFNNAARNGVSFKVFGDFLRITGTDTGTSTQDPSFSPATTINDPPSGVAGYPITRTPLAQVGDLTSPTRGLGQSYFLDMPVLAILGTNNPSGEPRMDRDYPGYNFNISDQRRALRFIREFDRMVAAGTLPQYVEIYLPNDHTSIVPIQSGTSTEIGGVAGPAIPPGASTPSPAQQVADGDVALGMVVQHLLNSPVYYDAQTNTGSAIFMTYDDAQATVDHIHPHRTALVVASPFAKPGHINTRHYSTASIVKTTELLLGLPPNNYGDLFATDLRDLFQPTFNGINPAGLTFARTIEYKTSPEGLKIWNLGAELDTLAGPDRDSRRLGMLARLSMAADTLHHQALDKKELDTDAYRASQEALLKTARETIASEKGREDD